MAAKRGYGDLRVLIALPEAADRRNLRKALQAEGLLHGREAGEMSAMVDHVTRGEPDLLITTVNNEGWDSSDAIRQIRNGLLGPNPFLVILVLIEKPLPDLVGRAMGAGADDLMLPPWQARPVVDRLDNFVQGRKPFLVTHDYVGPERRTVLREEGVPASTLEVPNPVQWLSLSKGNPDRAAFRARVATALQGVNRRKINSCGGYLRVLADRAVEHFAEGGHKAILPIIHTLQGATVEMAQRATDTELAPALELTLSLRQLCQRLLREDRTPRAEEVSVLPSLAEAVVRAVAWTEPEPSGAAA